MYYSAPLNICSDLLKVCQYNRHICSVEMFSLVLFDQPVDIIVYLINILIHLKCCVIIDDIFAI